MNAADTILVLENEAGVPMGLLSDALDDAGLPYAVVTPHTGEPLPTTHRWRAIVSLGGVMGSYEDHRYPYLRCEKDLLASAVADDVPVLGICLGSQLLADALGGRAHRGTEPEIGYHPLRLTDAGRRHPVLAQASGPFFAWHRDTFDLPPGAELLATSIRYPHAYQRGSALGLQFHPEATADIARQWLDDASPQRLQDQDIDIDQVKDEIRRTGPAARHAGLSLLRSWIAFMAAPQRASDTSVSPGSPREPRPNRAPEHKRGYRS
jgi:GMP synthase-like glutamine amidotransferase